MSVALTELSRLQVIADLDLLSREVDEVLQGLCEKAAELLDAPVSLVSLVLDDAQYFAAMHGLQGWLAEARGTPVEWAFCRFAVADKEPFIVEDAAVHPLVRDNPLVTLEGVRCYLGMPLVTSSGFAIGTLCVLGTEARQFSEAQQAMLAKLAREAMDHIESRPRASTES